MAGFNRVLPSGLLSEMFGTAQPGRVMLLVKKRLLRPDCVQLRHCCAHDLLSALAIKHHPMTHIPNGLGRAFPLPDGLGHGACPLGITDLCGEARVSET